MTGTKRLLITAMALGLALPVSAAGTAAEAKPSPPKKKADLVVSTVTATASGGTMSVQATVKNKGATKAKASTTRLTLSSDATPSADDIVIGTLATGKLKARKSTTFSTTATLPSTPGSYVVIGCADAGGTVKEKKNTNNCAASAPFTVALATTPPATPPTTPPPSGNTVTVTVNASPGGTIEVFGTPFKSTCSGSGTTALSCAVTRGEGSVIVQAVADAGYVFDGWSGECGTAGPPGIRQFGKPTVSSTCLAEFSVAETITITYRLGDGADGVATTQTTGAASCTTTSTGGVCTTQEGSGTIRITAPRPRTGYTYFGWVGSDCNYTSEDNYVVYFAYPREDSTDCLAAYPVFG